MLRKQQFLETLKAVDVSPRDIISTDLIQFYCHTEGCGATGIKRFDKAVASVGKMGWAFQCDPCRHEKSATARAVTYTSQYLVALGAVDTTPRSIKARDWVLFKCYGCENTGEMVFYDAKRNQDRNGHIYQCKDCLAKKKRSNYAMKRGQYT